MSGIGGIVTFDERPVDDDVLARLGHGLDEYGPDGGLDVRRNSVGMVYRAFHTNVESRAERQPVVAANGCMLAWDGRLDNREELIALLRDELRDDRSDSSIVMQAYAKWGIAFLPGIIGDFALSLWDPSSKTLFLARDTIGARLLFYHADSERIIWSSRLESLLRLKEIELEVDEDYVAGFLSLRPKKELTPYKDIYAVPPANVVTARRGRVHSQRFWSLDPAKEIRYQTDREYEEHFIHVFSEAVRTRLRADGPVWADLSGGLDSSSIVCMADEIIKQGSADSSQLETVSAVFDESPSSDERRFIRHVEEKRGRVGHHFRDSEYQLLTSFECEGLRTIPNPLELWTEYHQGVRREMRDHGARVLLCGIGGDELLTASADPYPELADLLVQLKLSDLHQRLQVWSLTLKKPYLHVLLRHAVMPSLPRRVQSACRRRQLAKQLSLLQPAFSKRFDIADRLLGPKDIFGCRLPSSRGQATAFLSVTDVISPGHLLVWQPIEISYPFTHRPLVEFLQAIPATQWVRPGETRSLMRRAMRPYLPPQIAARKGKGTPAEATLRAVAREWPRLRELLRNALVCAGGYVNPIALKTLIEKPNFSNNPEDLTVLRVAYLELWLRDFERRPRAVSHSSAVEMPARNMRAESEKVARAYS
ncbi:MAG TPA: asparagine synthase-related protein [Pyrinomonadaceae bacterium]|nr:asparagine synthase-related protein [Pyrinomonadaceae bacterium]